MHDKQHYAEGDRLYLSAMYQSSNLSSCDGCQRMRRWNNGDGWQVIRDDGGYPLSFCPRHAGSREEMLAEYETACEDARKEQKALEKVPA